MEQAEVLSFGIAVVFIGIFIILSSLLFLANEKNNVKFSFFGFLWFVPFGISNDKRLFAISTVIIMMALIFMALYIYRYVK